ncbi:hypothetical protein GDO81_009656 [Engystomops pustulosus]|uniref:Uncharacterized protein n=1 Tax=Engystomops pustulosus TaxID=76066 RepID=A0AAV7BSU9_ENGPU|nr:hypothetical protein GDO81_009656 [Engystomops pustulosus]
MQHIVKRYRRPLKIFSLMLCPQSAMDVSVKVWIIYKIKFFSPLFVMLCIWGLYNLHGIILAYGVQRRDTYFAEWTITVVMSNYSCLENAYQ